MSQELTLAALALPWGWRNPAPGLVHHSDRGPLYAPSDYQKVLLARGITASMSRKGDCWDNAPMESANGTVKVECVHGKNSARAPRLNRRWSNASAIAIPNVATRPWATCPQRHSRSAGMAPRRRPEPVEDPCGEQHRVSTAGRFPVRRKRPNRPAVDNAPRLLASTKRLPAQTSPTAAILHPVAASCTVAVEQSRESALQPNGGLWLVARGQPWLTVCKHQGPTTGCCIGFLEPRPPLTSPPSLCEDARRWAHSKTMTETADHSRTVMNNMERIYQIDQILGARHCVTRKELQERLAVSWATLKRDLAYMRVSGCEEPRKSGARRWRRMVDC